MATKKTFDFGELRSLLELPPSWQGWDKLCELVTSAGWEAAADQWLPYAQDKLNKGWPDHLRVWPQGWWKNKRAPSAAIQRALVRTSYDTTNRQVVDRFIEQLIEIAPPLSTLTFNTDAYPDADQLGAAIKAVAPTLRTLSIDNYSSAGLIGALRKSGALPRLKALRLFNNNLEAPELAALIESGQLGELDELRLAYQHRLAIGICDQIGASDLPTRLTALTLTRTMSREATPDQDAHGLARADWPRLTQLDLSDTPTSADALTALLARAPRITTLRLSGAPLEREGDLAALGAAINPAIEQLWIDRCGLTDAGIAALLATPRSRLRVLSMGETGMGPLTAAALQSGPIANALETLDLSGPVRVEAAFMSALAGARFERLEVLNLRDTTLDAEASAALLTLQLPALRAIDLTSARLSPPTRDAIRAAGWRIVQR